MTQVFLHVLLQSPRGIKSSEPDADLALADGTAKLTLGVIVGPVDHRIAQPEANRIKFFHDSDDQVAAFARQVAIIKGDPIEAPAGCLSPFCAGGFASMAKRA